MHVPLQKHIEKAGFRHGMSHKKKQVIHFTECVIARHCPSNPGGNMEKLDTPSGLYASGQEARINRGMTKRLFWTRVI